MRDVAREDRPVERVPRKKWDVENGAKIGTIGRTLPEYFTDDPVVKPAVIRAMLAIKSYARRARTSLFSYFFIRLYFPDAFGALQCPSFNRPSVELAIDFTETM